MQVKGVGSETTVFVVERVTKSLEASPYWTQAGDIIDTQQVFVYE